MPGSSPSFDDEQLAAAFANVLREQLTESRSVHVPQFGTFSVSHELSEIKQLDRNEIEVTPPRRTVAFEPAKSF